MRYEFFLHDMLDGKKVRSHFVVAKRFDQTERTSRHKAIDNYVINNPAFAGYLNPNAEWPRINSYWSAEGMG